MPAIGGAENVGQGLAGKRVELVLVELRPLDGHRLALRLLDDEIRDELVAAAFLVLLAARMEIAGVDDRQRRGALAVLAETLGQELVVPKPDASSPLPQVESTRMVAPRRVSISRDMPT